MFKRTILYVTLLLVIIVALFAIVKSRDMHSLIDTAEQQEAPVVVEEAPALESEPMVESDSTAVVPLQPMP